MPDASADTTTTTTPVKSGWKTTEHALSLLAMILTGLFASGTIPVDGWPAKVAAIAAVTLTALGYTVVRGNVKSAATMLLVIMLAFGGSQATGCAATQKELSDCQKPENVNTTKCTVINDLVACTKNMAPTAAEALLTLGEALIAQFLSADGSVDVPSVSTVFGHLPGAWGVCLAGGVLAEHIHAPPKLAHGEVAPSVGSLRALLAATMTAKGIDPAKTSVETHYGAVHP